VYGNAEGGGDDRQKLLSLWAQLSTQGQGNRPNATAQMNLSILRAKTLLQQNERAYGALVAQLRDRGSIDQCKAAIDQHKVSPIDQPSQAA
jgi:hypothetical protein